MRILASLLFLLSCSQVQSSPRDLAAELKPAQTALAAKDYSTAYDGLLQFADRNPLAQFTLGLFEQQAWGRPANAAVACDWFAKAALGKVPAAQQLLGDCLARGIGRAVDGPAALHWYEQAARSGIAYAWCSAGELYIAGVVVPKDTARGIALCAAAAQAGSPPAMLRLADYYREGRDMPADPRLARYWYQQAAQQHQHEAQFRLGIMLSEGQGGDADVVQARAWLEQAATEGYARAYLPLAILYANATPDPATGALTPDDLAKVYMWNSAAKATTTNPAQLAEIARIEKLSLAAMPAPWKPVLDRRVAEHLARHDGAGTP
ncbi:tetratricopeptide repeat protein [Herbaspirillum sp. YR522]|uniref:tetratricopeptide repeat protein n=1 Tax=Herbaspirillum sp. YR522 TaxID=1144342 RepID=UPI00026F7F89|nr:tetratricopeptide repeat protein [Herbaspirillum sp. YR522]EJN03235.1 Sel1 repeat protein [Herbaspirillum sp. YR522]